MPFHLKGFLHSPTENNTAQNMQCLLKFKPIADQLRQKVKYLSYFTNY